MEQNTRFNYFHQNPNALVNGQSAFNQPMDGATQSVNYPGNTPAMSSQDPSLFHERKHTTPNAVPLMNPQLYHMGSTDQPPLSSGPPRTNAKGIYENSQSSIPSLAQSNAENYPINPDFQLQPHLTGLLPQQYKKAVPELYPVDKYNTSRSSIANNMNTNYFSSNKSYPEPKIIEYDAELTSTESSPQHTSSLYSESTDQDSESIHQANVYSRNLLDKNIECQVTKESKTISTSNQEFPVPSQFADLNLDNIVDDHQHSILHSAYNQDDDIIEDIPLSNDTNQKEKEQSLENQENPESQFNEQSFKTPRSQSFDYYSNNKTIGQTEFNYDNKPSSSQSSFNNKISYSSYNSNNSSNIQNSTASNMTHFSQTSTQPNSISLSSQSKPLFPYNNSEMFSLQQESSNTQNYYGDKRAADFNQQNKPIQSFYQSTNVPPIDSKLQSNVDSSMQDKRILNPSVSQAPVLNDQNRSRPDSSVNNLYNQQNVQNIESINQQQTFNSSKPPAYELSNDGQSSKQFTAFNSSLTPSPSSGPVTSTVLTTPTSRSSSSVSEKIVHENITYQTSDDQTSRLFNVSNSTKTSTVDSINQNLTTMAKSSEYDSEVSQSNSNSVENQQETIIDQSKPIDKQSKENQQDNQESLSLPPNSDFVQPNNFFNSMNQTSQPESNYQKSPINQFTSQQSVFDNLKTSNNQILSNSMNSTTEQNSITQNFVPTSNQNTSHYFDSVISNNQSVFNRPTNLQSYNKQPNANMPIVKSIPLSDDHSDTLKTSNIQNTSLNPSSSQPPLSMNTEVNATEALNESNNVSPNETVSTPTVSSHSNNTEAESIKQLENNSNIMTFSHRGSDSMTPKDQFSNMKISDKENMQTFNQKQTTPASYFSKETPLDNDDKLFSSTINNSSSTTSELSGFNDKSQFSTITQTNLPFLNPVQLITQDNSPLPVNNQTVSDEKLIAEPIANQYSSQLNDNIYKTTPSTLSSTNQLPPQMFSNQPKPDAVPSQSTLQQDPVQPFKNQFASNTVPTVSSANNQLPPQMFSYQPKPDAVPSQSTLQQDPVQPFKNQFASNTVPTVSSANNQLPPQMFSNQPKPDAVPSQSTFQQDPVQPFKNQFASNTVPTVSSANNQLPPQMFSNQPKTVNMPPFPSVSNQFQTQPFINQVSDSKVQPVSSVANQFSPQIFNTQPKSEMVSSQSTASQNPVQPFNNQSTQSNIVPSVSSTTAQVPPQMFSNQPKPVTMPPLPPVANQHQPQSFNNIASENKVKSFSPAANQFSPQVFNSNNASSVFQPPTSQYSSQSFSNPPTLNSMKPVSTSSNQLPPQILSNQPKSGIVSPLQSTSQYPIQPFNNQSRTSSVPPISSSANQLPPQMLSNQPKLDVVPPLQGTSQYSTQPFNNQLRSNMVPPIRPAVNQSSPQILSNQPLLSSYPNKLNASHYPPHSVSSNQSSHGVVPQLLNSQSKPNPLPPQSNTNQYSSQQLSSQPGQQYLSKPNHQPPQSNQFYNQPNSIQPMPNQWPPHSNVNQPNQQSTIPPMNANFLNQTSSASQPPLSSMHPTNLSTLPPPSVNQQTQRLDSQILPPSNLSSNYNYYNQGNANMQQSRPTAMSPNQQMNKGFHSQSNYQQPNTVQGQQGFYNQQQDPYRPEQNASVVQQGFAKTWGYDNVDLLKSRDVLPGDGVQPPEIKLPQGYANCDNCSPDIFRCTLNKFPSSKNLLDKSRLPLGILIHPYKDLSRLTVIQCETITRCRNCRSYINPFVQFIDNAHWKCNLCYRVNDLPGEFQIDPYTKTLGDPSRRPEIQNATIEYIASQDYMVRPPQPALYLFLLDVSRTATLTGYLEIVCDRILNKIMADDIPGDSRTNIGFITYDSSVHFYQIANSDSGGCPKQLVVSDISDIFLPLPDGLMVNLEENKAAIKDLLTSLPNLFRESYNTGSALGAALQAAFKMLAPRGGRVTVFQACLPNAGPGSLQPRDDGNPHTGDRVQHMSPSTDFYKKLALECSAEQIAVDLFFISSQYLDIASVSGISKYSAGCLHNFAQFDVKSPTIVTRFINCFDRYLSRKIGFEALLRLRCTRGVAIHSFHGNFFVRSSDLLMLPNVNPDNAYGMQLSIEDSLEGAPVVCFQAALLYTSSNAERRIRVHTLCIPVTDNLNDVFHNADQQAITCLIAKMAVDRSTEKSLTDAREAFFNAISDSLSAYKLGCSSYNGPGTMLSPLSLKMFPLYILATLKHAAFRTNQATRLDERIFSMCQMKSLPLSNLIQYIYPDLYPIHSLEEQPKIDYEKLTEIPLPPVLQLSAERIESNGIYLMDDCETLTIFIGHRCSDQLIQKLFGYVNVNSMPELITTLTEVDSKPSYLLRSFISYVQHFKPYPLPIEIIKDNGPHKLRFYSRLIEDKFESSLSYYEFLQRLSQQVR